MRFRRLLSGAAAVAVLAGPALVQPAHASTRIDAIGHIVISSNPTTGLPTYQVSGVYLTQWDCGFEQGSLGDRVVIVLCTPKATIVDTTWFCGSWILTATASPGPAGVGTGEVRGTASCKDAGGDAVTKLVTSGGTNTTDQVITTTDPNVDVWAVRCYASGTGVNGRPSPGFYVNCYEPSAMPVQVR